YTYLWSNGATTQDISGLLAGTYTVTITDANGCETTDGATVGQPQAPLTCSIFLVQHVSINGGNDGSAVANFSGGSAPFTYLWANGETTQQATALTAGTQSVTVTDANGCTTMCEVLITEPDELLCDISLVNNVLCFGESTGSATANPTGGVAPFSYSWDNGETTQTALALNVGLHSVLITDANGAQT
ncbi:SprB repeat-containing protein, partial [Muriicola sp. Z0-33]|uniref:SprB repeat-containing protein n=1 Tax=Muriicola sp. Z0-33 TaxID=2816957 RepID=UPI0022389661